MSPWVLRGLREGVVTTRWPAKPDEYADTWRGPAIIVQGRPEDAVGLAALCPTGAITTAADAVVRLDQGRCILCGECVRRRPDVFGWSEGVASGGLTRTALVVPEQDGSSADVAAVRSALAERTTALRR